MLRDLYQFPVIGHIDAIAFDPDAIGRARYNSAQAALRRACSRLEERTLIAARSGYTRGLFFEPYNRAGIGLRETGVIIADKLIEQNRI